MGRDTGLTDSVATQAVQINRIRATYWTDEAIVPSASLSGPRRWRSSSSADVYDAGSDDHFMHGMRKFKMHAAA
jgi:hypothetical protein